MAHAQNCDEDQLKLQKQSFVIKLNYCYVRIGHVMFENESILVVPRSKLPSHSQACEDC